MSVRSSQSITFQFTTRRVDTGAIANADSTPTGTLVINGVDNGATVTVTNITTGIYRAAVTLPTLTIGDVVECRIAATVNAIADAAVLWRDTADVGLDSSGRLLLQPTQTGVTIPTVTALTNAVTVGTNNDKTGYSLTQAFPANFASLSITAGGIVSSQLANGVAHGGSTATLRLGSSSATPALQITNSNGNAVYIEADGPSCISILNTSNTGIGVQIVSLGASGRGIFVESTNEALSLDSLSNSGLVIFGAGSSAVLINSNANNNSIVLTGSSGSGEGRIVGNIDGDLLGKVTGSGATSIAGIGAWVAGAGGTAVSTLTAGAQMALVDNAITEAKIVTPTLSAPATGVLGMIVQVWRRFFKASEYNKTVGTIKTFADDNTTVVTTQNVTTGAGADTIGPAT